MIVIRKAHVSTDERISMATIDAVGASRMHVVTSCGNQGQGEHKIHEDHRGRLEIFYSE